MGDEVTITRLDPDRYRVDVRQGSTTTSHQVRVPARLVDDLGLVGVEHEDLVRASFGFLLEREPATSILPEFGLDVISRYFPEYPDELATRLGDGA
jgi:hypothetical protein